MPGTETIDERELRAQKRDELKEEQRIKEALKKAANKEKKKKKEEQAVEITSDADQEYEEVTEESPEDRSLVLGGDTEFVLETYEEFRKRQEEKEAEEKAAEDRRLEAKAAEDRRLEAKAAEAKAAEAKAAEAKAAEAKAAEAKAAEAKAAEDRRLEAKAAEEKAAEEKAVEDRRLLDKKAAEEEEARRRRKRKTPVNNNPDIPKVRDGVIKTKTKQIEPPGPSNDQDKQTGSAGSSNDQDKQTGPAGSDQTNPADKKSKKLKASEVKRRGKQIAEISRITKLPEAMLPVVLGLDMVNHLSLESEEAKQEAVQKEYRTRSLLIHPDKMAWADEPLQELAKKAFQRLKEAMLFVKVPMPVETNGDFAPNAFDKDKNDKPDVASQTGGKNGKKKSRRSDKKAVKSSSHRDGNNEEGIEVNNSSSEDGNGSSEDVNSSSEDVNSSSEDHNSSSGDDTSSSEDDSDNERSGKRRRNMRLPPADNVTKQFMKTKTRPGVVCDYDESGHITRKARVVGWTKVGEKKYRLLIKFFIKSNTFPAYELVPASHYKGAREMYMEITPKNEMGFEILNAAALKKQGYRFNMVSLGGVASVRRDNESTFSTYAVTLLLYITRGTGDFFMTYQSHATNVWGAQALGDIHRYRRKSGQQAPEPPLATQRQLRSFYLTNSPHPRMIEKRKQLLLTANGEFADDYSNEESDSEPDSPTVDDSYIYKRRKSKYASGSETDSDSESESESESDIEIDAENTDSESISDESEDTERRRRKKKRSSKKTKTKSHNGSTSRRAKEAERRHKETKRRRKSAKHVHYRLPEPTSEQIPWKTKTGHKSKSKSKKRQAYA